MGIEKRYELPKNTWVICGDLELNRTYLFQAILSHFLRNAKGQIVKEKGKIQKLAKIRIYLHGTPRRTPIFFD